MTGTEEGWREASDPRDPRYSMKQRDIKQTVQKAVDNNQRAKDAHADAMEADYYEGALELANAMLGNFKVGYSRRYAANFDKVFGKGDK
jgi:hypothetical protein